MASKYLHKYKVPDNFQQTLHTLIKFILRDQPRDIVHYSACYFDALYSKKEFKYNPNFQFPEDKPKQPQKEEVVLEGDIKEYEAVSSMIGKKFKAKKQVEQLKKEKQQQEQEKQKDEQQQDLPQQKTQTQETQTQQQPHQQQQVEDDHTKHREKQQQQQQQQQHQQQQHHQQEEISHKKQIIEEQEEKHQQEQIQQQSQKQQPPHKLVQQVQQQQQHMQQQTEEEEEQEQQQKQEEFQQELEAEEAEDMQQQLQSQEQELEQDQEQYQEQQQYQEDQDEQQQQNEDGELQQDDDGEELQQDEENMQDLEGQLEDYLNMENQQDNSQMGGFIQGTLQIRIVKGVNLCYPDEEEIVTSCEVSISNNPQVQMATNQVECTPEYPAFWEEDGMLDMALPIDQLTDTKLEIKVFAQDDLRAISQIHLQPVFENIGEWMNQYFPLQKMQQVDENDQGAIYLQFRWLQEGIEVDDEIPEVIEEQ